MMGPTATLRKDSPRRAQWMEVFGSDSVPVTSPVPVKNKVKGEEEKGVREWYMIDVKRLKPDQRRNVARALSRVWKLPPDQVLALMDDPKHGVPLLAEDLAVSTDLRLFV